MTTTFPTTASEITAEWLTETLRSSEVIGDETSVAEIIFDPSRAGVGFIGEVASIGVVYDGGAADAPTRLVAKFPTQSPEIRAMMHPTRIYAREHSFYGDLARKSPMRTPRVYHITNEAAEEAADERYLLLMEDLSGLTLGDQVTGTTPEQSRSALVALAEHHARFWNGRDLEDASYLPVINGPLNQAGSSIYEVSLPGFMEAFGTSIKQELAAFVADYAAARPKILDDLAAMPRTFVHFDFRADNLFFDEDGTVVVVDWQTISQGGGAADVGYFLSQNLGVDDRRAHEDELLHAYHDTLVANGVVDYDFDTLVEDYRVGIACGWMIPVLAVGSLDFTSERAVQLWTAVIERVQTALIDHGMGA